MPLTESEKNEIREEAEKEHPIDIRWSRGLGDLDVNLFKRNYYIQIVTKERERVKPLLEALELIIHDCDNDGTYFIIKETATIALTNYNKSLKQTP